MPERFYLICPEPELVNVCFWYIPKRMRKIPHSKEKEEELGRVSILSCSFSIRKSFPKSLRQLNFFTDNKFNLITLLTLFFFGLFLSFFNKIVFLNSVVKKLIELELYEFYDINYMSSV